MTAPRPVDADFIALQRALAGRYSLERELGRGGMGIVYLAREVRLDRQVAIKVLPPGSAARGELRDRFLREARLAAQLSHPHIVPIFHVDEADDWVYFVMAWIDGETLGHRVRTRGPLAAAAAARMMREVSWALAYAHLRGIIHSDIKPDNILLERGSGRALVSDFGIARLAADSARDGDGQVMGSAQFISPEQAAGSPFDGRSDLYSLGIAGYYALTGRLPFEGSDAAALVAAHLGQTPAPVSAWAPAVPRKLAAAVDRCLAKRPEQRFASGEALAEAVEQSVEAPREIPVPLRVWLSRTERLPLPLVLAAIWATPLSIGLTVATSPLLGPLPLLAVGGVIAGTRLAATRRALKAGYSLEDLRAALRQHIALRREERAMEHAESRTADVALAVAATGTIALTAFLANAMPALRSGPRSVWPLVLGITGAAAFVTSSVAAAAWIRRLTHRWFGRSRLRFWNSEGGAIFARLAGAFLHRIAPPADGMRQATELALGKATDLLFAALPKAVRRQLGDLPSTVRHLESEAGRMRGTLDRIDEGIAALSDLAPAGADPTALDRDRQGLADDLRARRERAAERLGVAVSALETIRLDLLRLTTGGTDTSSATASLTAAIESASRIGAEVSGLADAAREVDEFLADDTGAAAKDR